MVVDASAVVELLLGSAKGLAVAAALQEAEDAGPVAAPDLLDVEVLHVFRRLVASGRLEEGRAAEAVDLLRRLKVGRHPVGPLVPRVWAHRHNLTAYDAVYVALAEALERPLLTCDGRLGDAPGHVAEVRIV